MAHNLCLSSSCLKARGGFVNSDVLAAEVRVAWAGAGILCELWRCRVGYLGMEHQPLISCSHYSDSNCMFVIACVLQQGLQARSLGGNSPFLVFVCFWYFWGTHT